MAPWRAGLLVFLVHLAVQCPLLPFLPARQVLPHARYEVTAVAFSLYERGTFADPYCLPTGPTAHVPPFHPLLLASLYRALGPTAIAGYATWVLLIASYGALYGLLPWLGRELGLGTRAGLLGGLAGALLPRWPGYVEGLTGVSIGLMVAAFARRWTSGRATLAGSFALGVAIGLSFHVSPSLLAVALGFVAVELLAGGSDRPGALRPRLSAALALLGMALACLPWTLRNHAALGGLIFMRSNFGLELRMGNHEGAAPTLGLSQERGTLRHPRSLPEEAREVRRLGELAYMRAAEREARAWIRSHPLAFARLTLLRVAQFWLGPLDDVPVAVGTALLTLLAAAGARRAWPCLGAARRAALLIPLVTFPLVYYVVGYEARYREPLDGLLLVLAGFAVSGPGPQPDDPARAPIRFE